MEPHNMVTLTLSHFNMHPYDVATN